MTTRHAMDFYTQDYRTSSVRSRSIMDDRPMLRLVYLEALCALHERRGRLPAEPEDLEPILGIRASVIAAELPELLRLGQKGRGGLVRVEVEGGGQELYNRRLAEDLADAEAFSEIQRERGRRGGQQSVVARERRFGTSAPVLPGEAGASEPPKRALHEDEAGASSPRSGSEASPSPSPSPSQEVPRRGKGPPMRADDRWRELFLEERETAVLATDEPFGKVFDAFLAERRKKARGGYTAEGLVAVGCRLARWGVAMATEQVEKSIGYQGVLEPKPWQNGGGSRRHSSSASTASTTDVLRDLGDKS